MIKVIAPLFVLTFSSPALAQVFSTASANIASSKLSGINMAGCEFAENAALCPTPATADAYADMGFRAMRIPVRSRQLAAAIPRLQTTVIQAQRRGALVVIDLHDYLPLDPARIVPLIQRVSSAFGPDVYIDYDNEPGAPTGFKGDMWVASANATNAIIRGARSAGVKNPLVVEWPGYSGNYRAFPATEEATFACRTFGCGLDRVGGLKDPLAKTVLGPHRYYDVDGSGTHAECVPAAWYWDKYFAGAEARGYRTIIGESAFGNARSGVPASCKAAGQAIMSQIMASGRTVAYMTWGGGRGWNSAYQFIIPPESSAKNSSYVRQIVGGAK